MKKCYVLTVAALFLAVLTTIFFSGCSLQGILGPLNTPPDVDSVQQQLLNNWDDIQVIVAFLTESNYEWAYIDDASGTLLADLTTVPIDNPEVSDAVFRLFDKGYYTSILKDGTTISFEQWRAFQLDIECGIAYSTDKTANLNVQFLTEAVALSEEDWFYYVADYELWRIENGK